MGKGFILFLCAWICVASSWHIASCRIWHVDRIMKMHKFTCGYVYAWGYVLNVENM